MFTPSDIVVLILLVGSGILIWIARRASLAQREDTAKTHDHEHPPSVEQKETHGETNNHSNHCQSKKSEAPCDCK